MTAAARPPEAPLAMPAQRLGEKPQRRTLERRSRLWRKAVVLGLAFALTAWATREMHAVLDVMGVTVLEWILLCAFTINIGWIAFAFISASLGFLWEVHRQLTGQQAVRRRSGAGASARSRGRATCSVAVPGRACFARQY